MGEGRVLPLVYYPDKRLRQISEPAKREEMKACFDDLIASIDHYSGLGLAGVQIGIMKAMFVVDHDYLLTRDRDNYSASPEIKERILCVANPKVIYTSDEMVSGQEGCLSLPGSGAYAAIQRASKIKIEYQDYNGDAQTLEAGGLLSACIQHEYDHTIGKLIIDHMSTLKRELFIKKVQKHMRLYKPEP